MEELKLVQAQFAPFRRMDGLAVHAPRETTEVPCKCWVVDRIRRAPGITRNGIGKYGDHGRNGQCPRQVVRRIERTPRPGISGSETLKGRRLLYTAAPDVLAEILKRDEGIADAALRPVKKHAAIRGHKNVSGIEVDVAEGVREAKTLEQLTCFLESFTERNKL